MGTTKTAATPPPLPPPPPLWHSLTAGGSSAIVSRLITCEAVLGCCVWWGQAIWLLAAWQRMQWLALAAQCCR
jgi:hypothetical protein